MNNIGEIKKVLYKEKPIANYVGTMAHYKIYRAETSIGEVHFRVPFEEVTSKFKDEMESQLLIRWIDPNF